MKRNLFGGAIVCALTAMTLVGTAGTANAVPGCGGGCEGSYWKKVGTGRYQLRVEDSKKDGYGVLGIILKKSNAGYVEDNKYVGGGAGDSFTFTRNWSAGYVTFQVCTVDGPDHRIIDCDDRWTVG
ncbi:hypothetical protein OH799_06300 [Nocardia sp. NBC_00881]|uniref:hypothetical protein n=1 Tax=Nocardia sp. NBC_00881 TaxID=2975995 RepID=UPI00386C69FF|nr:hypothetical protein OH799_06300 [Nocardia sp. NBC_00881]